MTAIFPTTNASTARSQPALGPKASGPGTRPLRGKPRSKDIFSSCPWPRSTHSSSAAAAGPPAARPEASCPGAGSRPSLKAGAVSRAGLAAPAAWAQRCRRQAPRSRGTGTGTHRPPHPTSPLLPPLRGLRRDEWLQLGDSGGEEESHPSAPRWSGMFFFQAGQYNGGGSGRHAVRRPHQGCIVPRAPPGSGFLSLPSGAAGPCWRQPLPDPALPAWQARAPAWSHPSLPRGASGSQASPPFTPPT